MKALVMLSGGVESTALLKHALDNDIEVEAVHAYWDNKTKHEALAARAISNYYDIQYSDMGIQADDLFKKYRNITVPDSPWWGSVAVMAAPIVKCTEIWFGSYLGESAPGASGPAGVNLILQSVGCEARTKSPLYRKTKSEQWDMLDDNVKEMVVSCIKQYKHNGENCIKRNVKDPCQKCKEWAKWQIVRGV